jgi:hypothetical protein
MAVLGRVRVSCGAFRQFKSRHNLLSPKQFRLNFGDQPWLRPELSFVAVHDAFERLGQVTSLGKAAADVVAFGAQLRWGKPDHNLGMLPVEIVLWSRAFHLLLSTYGLTYLEWKQMSEVERLGFWKHWTSDDPASDLQKFMREPAALALQERGVQPMFGEYGKSFGWDCASSAL